MKIAILGAGPGGLSAAERLKEKGYQDVTVFEMLNRVGGHSLSQVYKTTDGREIIYDMGSIQPMPNKVFMHLFQKAGLHFGRGVLSNQTKLLSFYDFEKQAYAIDFKKYYLGYPIRQLPLLLHDLGKLAYHLWRFRKLKKSGFYDCPQLSEAAMPLQQWISNKNFKIIQDGLIFALCSAASGSSLERATTVPALYGIKTLFQMLGYHIRYIDGTYQPVKEGYQALWKAIAQHHDVRLGVQIETVIRDKAGVQLVLNGQSQQFDKLIVAFPIGRAKKLFDMTPEEHYLADRVHYCPVWRGWLIAKHLPKDRVLIFPENYFSAHADKLLLPILIPEGEIDKEAVLYSFILQTGKGEVPPTDELLQNTEKKLKAHFGAEIIEWSLSKQELYYWKYYKPYFACEDVKDGIYQKHENIQGKHHTFYTNSLLSGDGHAHVAAYSFDLIDRFFP